MRQEWVGGGAPPPGGFNGIRTGALFYFLKLDVLKNSVLEGSGFDFGGPGPQFWSLRSLTWKLQSPAESQQMLTGANMLRNASKFPTGILWPPSGLGGIREA